MILLANVLIGLAAILNLAINFFIFLFIARAILSWVNPDPYNFIVQFVYNATEPILGRVRRKIPPLGMLDLSVLIAIAVLYFVQIVVVGSLQDYGGSLRSYHAARVFGASVAVPVKDFF